MRTYDFTPLFRSTVGFDRWSNVFEAALRDEDSAAGFPPYNIEKTGDDKYRKPWPMANLGGAHRLWTLDGLAEHLARQWGERPEGIP